MNQNLKYILITIIILAVLSMFVFSESLGIEIGALFASIAGGFAAFKAKLLGNTSSVAEQIEKVENEHATKREEWQLLKNEFDSKYNALKARMDYLDYKSALISSEILELDEHEKAAIQNNHNLSEEEILQRLRNL